MGVATSFCTEYFISQLNLFRLVSCYWPEMQSEVTSSGLDNQPSLFNGALIIMLCIIDRMQFLGNVLIQLCMLHM